VTLSLSSSYLRPQKGQYVAVSATDGPRARLSIFSVCRSTRAGALASHDIEQRTRTFFSARAARPCSMQEHPGRVWLGRFSERLGRVFVIGFLALQAIRFVTEVANVVLAFGIFRFERSLKFTASAATVSNT
jgi:hypothetical protein